jgi:hypothetical protein
MTALLKVPLEQAVATSLIAAALSFAPTIAVSFVFMAAQGFSMRDLKARAPEVV